MANTSTYSVVITPAREHLCLTLLVQVWHPHQGNVPRQLESVWLPWEGWQLTARRLLTEAVALAHDQYAEQERLFNDTPKASAPPGGPRGVLSVPDAKLKTLSPPR